MAFGPEMIVQSRHFGDVHLGEPAESILAASPPLTDNEKAFLRPRFINNLARGWIPFVDRIAQLPADESQFWAISDADQALAGIMHVFRDPEPGTSVRPPHDWVTYIVLREKYWGGGLSTDVRSVRQYAAFTMRSHILALHASVKDANEASWKGIVKLGGVRIGADPVDPTRSEYITVNPNRDHYERYWEQALTAGLISDTSDTHAAFEHGRWRTELALKAAAEIIRIC